MSLYDKIRSNSSNRDKLDEDMKLVQLIQKVRNDLLIKVQMKKFEGKQEDAARVEIIEMIDKYLLEQNKFLAKNEKVNLAEQIIQDINGLGPLQPLLDDDDVSEIMVNGPKQIFVEKNGRIKKSSQMFLNDDHVINVIEKIISPLGRRIDESSPMVDARLKDGSRLNAIIPPLSLVGPVITIRKFRKHKLTIDSLINYKSLNSEMARFLEQAVKARLNILVAGGTGSGKTTLLNILSSFIPKDERIVTIEDAAELQLEQPHVVSLETRPPNIEGKGEVKIRDLVRNSLRMRPDRIIVGEVRGSESLDMLQAMNTGHDGSISTIHANSPRDVISRLETLVLMAGIELPIKAIRQQIASAVDLIVLQKRLPDGSRKITHITAVEGVENELITLQDIFKYTPSEKSKVKRGTFNEVGMSGEVLRRNGVDRR